MLTRSVLLLPLLLSSVLCWSQQACDNTFTGIVVDEAEVPLPGAALTLSTTTGALSGEDGRFRFDKLCTGDFTLTVRLLGYEDLPVKLRIAGNVTREIHLKESTTQLEEVVIQHHDAAHTETATNYTELDERQLAERAGKSLGEVIREIPGVNSIQTGPGIFKPVIHGVHSQRVLILNHGIRQEGQQWGAEHAPEIDPFMASNVVVVKDASAIKYGSDAMGGTIIVNPDDLPEEAGIGGAVNTVLQSNGLSGTFSGMLQGGVPNHDGWGWRVNGTAKRTGDFRAANYNLTNTGVSELNFAGALGYHRERAGFDVYFSRFQTELGILKGTAIGNLDDLENAMERSEPLYTADFSYGISAPRQTVNHNLLKVNGHLNTNHGEFRLQYGYQRNNRKEYDLRMGTLVNTPAMDLQLSTHTMDTEWESSHARRAVFTAGGNLMLQNNRNVPGTKRIPFIPNFYTVNVGGFGVVKIDLDPLVLDIGVRYDYRHYDVKGYDYKNTYYNMDMAFNNASGTLGATYTINKKQTLRFNFSSAWRPPHVAELFSLGTHQSAAAIEYGLLLNDTTNEIMDIGDVNFKTEQAVKFVVGYQLDWRKWSFLIEPYLNYILNYTYLRPTGITTNVRGAFPYFRYTQTDASFLGTDVSVILQATHHLKVTGTAALLRATDERNDDYLVYVPTNRFDVAVRYERPMKKFARSFYVESKLRYVARQNRAPRVVTVREIQDAADDGVDVFQDPSNFDFLPPPDAYTLLNLAGGFSFKKDRVQYDLRIASENTLNQAYREYTNRFRYYADDLGRNVIISLKAIF